MSDYSPATSEKEAADLQQAINQKCEECLFDPGCPGTPRMQIEGCDCKSCPLHPFRPTQTTAEKLEYAAYLADTARLDPSPLPTHRVGVKAANISGGEF
jgi:hypothetical protein